MTRQMAKEILLQGGKVTHDLLDSEYLQYNEGIRTKEGMIYSCEFYNTYLFRIGWTQIN